MSCAAALGLGACSSMPLQQEGRAVVAAPVPSTIVEHLTVFRLQGAASLFNGSERSSLKNGDAISEGQPIEVSRRSRVRLNLGDRAFFELGPGSRLIVLRLPRSAPDEDLSTSLRLERGYLRIVSEDPSAESAEPIEVSFSRWSAKLAPGEYFFDSATNESWACAMGGSAQLSGNPQRTPPSIDDGCVNLRPSDAPVATSLHSEDWQRIRNVRAVARTARSASSTRIARAIDRMEKHSVAQSMPIAAKAESESSMLALPPSVPVSVAYIPAVDFPPSPPPLVSQTWPILESSDAADGDGESSTSMQRQDSPVARIESAPDAGAMPPAPAPPATEPAPIAWQEASNTLPPASTPVAPVEAAPAPTQYAAPDVETNANEIAAFPSEASPAPHAPSPQPGEVATAQDIASPVDPAASFETQASAAQPDRPMMPTLTHSLSLSSMGENAASSDTDEGLSSNPLPSPEAATAAAATWATQSSHSAPSPDPANELALAATANAPVHMSATPVNAAAAGTDVSTPGTSLAPADVPGQGPMEVATLTEATVTAPEAMPRQSEWIVNVQTYGSETEALDEVRRMQAQGYPGTIRQEVVRGRASYRVVIDGLPTEVAAREMLTRLDSDLGLKSAWVFRKH